MRFASLVLGLWLSILGGCLFWDHGKGECKATPVVDIAPIMLVNPDTLQCQAFSETICDPSCGLCPAQTNGDFAPAIPTWGQCQSTCTGLAETNCLANSQCRAARDWAQYYSGATTSFVGCFALDTARDTGFACAGRNAQDCSRSDQCTALYEASPNDCATCAGEQYKECIPKAQAAGACSGAVTCSLAKPTCPTNTLPGVANGCWTGSCIPQQFCPVAGG